MSPATETTKKITSHNIDSIISTLVMLTSKYPHDVALKSSLTLYRTIKLNF
jgi:hypothetical protein